MYFIIHKTPIYSLLRRISEVTPHQVAVTKPIVLSLFKKNRHWIKCLKIPFHLLYNFYYLQDVGLKCGESWNPNIFIWLFISVSPSINIVLKCSFLSGLNHWKSILIASTVYEIFWSSLSNLYNLCSKLLFISQDNFNQMYVFI